MAERAIGNYRLRRAYLTGLVHCDQYDTLIWDDVDGLLLRRPDTMLSLMEKHPRSVIAPVLPGSSCVDALQTWLTCGYRTDYGGAMKAFPCSGTSVAPVAMVADSIDRMQVYHRTIFARGLDSNPLTLQQGCWQAIAWRHGKLIEYPRHKCQVDILSLQSRPEFYHACTEKVADWFWEAFQAGYERLLDDPRDRFDSCPWAPQA